MSENEHGYVVEMEAPGLKSDQVDISVSNQVMTIRGKKAETDDRKNRTFHQVERQFGSFTRTVGVPDSTGKEHIQAFYKRGVLTIVVPKSG